MRPITVSVTGVGNSAPQPMDTVRNPFQVGFGVIVDGTITYTVQHTFDDIWAEDFDASSADWFDHPSVADLSANEDGNYAFPVRAIRLHTSAGTGTATLKLIQAGHRGA